MEHTFGLKLSSLTWLLAMHIQVVASGTHAYLQDKECKCCVGQTGPSGVPGIPGLQGAMGKDGHKGDKGEHGPSGPFGLKGESGVMGPSGEKGSRGRKGQKGEIGTKGGEGIKGAMGPRGYPGYKGDRGEKGLSSKPSKRIAFSASRTTKLGRVLQDTIVTFNNIFVNIGDNFDVYTSHFVCQLNGTYLFTAHIMGQNKIDAFAWLMVNNQHQLPLHGDGRAGFGSSSNTIILNLNVDDHVWIQLSKDSALLNDYSTFSGFLIFEN
ncbi:complement C1q tumor necrosis factor-related protein 7-like [Octopus sinensis]|uniref:Complement C1q tumor necrosis factor-related protein 7-like n=1 Tax=Octopus sinensis TaxID=2607531 RepID=A0A6P7SEB9_9MOLL|nr:complement C1q tumor necrosis factor-related protein 7-like [Octopus sinensis]